jgi:hypothetical protein
MLQWLENYLHFYTGKNMSKGYKQEFIQKVKAKNDLLTNSNKNTKSIGVASNDKGNAVCKSRRVVGLG